LIESIYEIKNLINKFNDKKILVLVEGKNDKIVLTKIGFKNIMCVSPYSNHEIIDKITSADVDEVIILTDFDSEGSKKAADITTLLQKNHIGVNNSIRMKVKKMFAVNKIEEIKNITKLFEDDYYGDISINDKILAKARFHNRRKILQSDKKDS
jgi:5S rRNA maturation endonuclease (ribonuclease M5)